MTEKIAK